MSNSNTNLQTQSLNALHNAIMEAGSNDRPPMLAPVLVAEGHSETTTERYMENYKNVSQDIRNQLNAEAEAVQIILTGIDNDIYSTVDACPNACEMWKAIKRLKQVNVQFLLQLQPEWQRFVTLVKQSQELKTVSYHKLYDILKQHQNEVNEIRVERLARTANPLALVAQQQPIYHHQNHPTQNTQYSSTRSQQSTRNRGKAIVTSFAPTYDPEPDTVTEDDEISKDKEIDKLMALISLSFKKIYKPTNNNLRTSSNTSRANQDNSPRINRGTGYDNQRAVNVAGARENVGTRNRSLRDDTDDESDDQELEAHYMYMAQLQEVTPDQDNYGPIFDDEPMHKVQNNNDNYNVFGIENEHPEQPDSSNDIYLAEHGDTNIIIDSLDICYDRVHDDQDDTDDLDQERELLASLIHKLKCEIDDSKNRNKLLESLICTDKAKTTRKRLKPGKNEPGNGRAHKKPRGSYQSQNLVISQSTQQQTSYSSSHWLKPKKECHIGLKEAQRKWQFTLVTLSKEAQDVSITDCQAGNPCEIRCDPTTKIALPIIERMYGQDWRSHIYPKRPRRFRRWL
ncbi:hypothetical protein Tco_1514822 [Tanacetum coccineum]